MPWYVLLFIIYIVTDRIAAVSMIGRRIDITPGFAVTSLIVGALQVWALLSLV